MTFSMKQVLSGSEILVGVLEEALKAGADSIRLEYEDTGLGVNFFSGELGSLVGIVPRDREQDVLASLIEKAGMVTKAHGEITIQLHGSEHVIDVKEFDSFGGMLILFFRSKGGKYISESLPFENAVKPRKHRMTRIFPNALFE